MVSQKMLAYYQGPTELATYSPSSCHMTKLSPRTVALRQETRKHFSGDFEQPKKRTKIPTRKPVTLVLHCPLWQPLAACGCWTLKHGSSNLRWVVNAQHIKNFEYFIYACVHTESLQLCLTLCDPMDCSPPVFSVHGIFQAGILEWLAMPKLWI